MDTRIEIGDSVRSHDFGKDPERDSERGACYVEGVVESIGIIRNEKGEPFASLGTCERYKVRVTRRVFAGDEHDEEALKREFGTWDGKLNGCAFPPVNGTPTLGGETTAYVEKIPQHVQRAARSGACAGASTRSPR